jgi:microcystin-dependent protein
MAYVKTIFFEWSESLAREMTTTEKVNGLNNLETQYDEGIAYMAAYSHDATYYPKTTANTRYYRTPSHPSGRSDTGHGCGIDADTLDGYTSAEVFSGGVPAGAIGIWAGTEASIPEGWYLCDGANGTPNLEGYMCLGAGGSYNPGDTGGSDSITPSIAPFDSPGHVLTDAELPAHTHDYYDYWNQAYDICEQYGGIADCKNVVSVASSTISMNGVAEGGAKASHKHTNCTFAGVAQDNRPPYKNKIFIMKGE